MTGITTSPWNSTPLIGSDSAARISLAAAGVAGDIAVSVGVRMFGGVAPFVAAVHDHRDAAVPLAPPVREQIRQFATAARVIRVLEQTARLGLSVLTPHCAAWPARLDAMRAAAPLVLWVRGNGRHLSTPSVAFSGSDSPGPAQRHHTIEIATGLSSRGWTIVSDTSSDVGGLALRSAEAMRSPWVLVSATSLTEREATASCGVDVSEVPPGSETSRTSRRRVSSIVAALASKVIVDDAVAAHPSALVREAAQAMRRPVGIMPDGPTGQHEVEPNRERVDLPRIGSISDADSFH